MLILFAALRNLLFQVLNGSGKSIEDADNAGLLGDGGDRDFKVCNVFPMNMRNTRSFLSRKYPLLIHFQPMEYILMKHWPFWINGKSI